MLGLQCLTRLHAFVITLLLFSKYRHELLTQHYRALSSAGRFLIPHFRIRSLPHGAVPNLCPSPLHLHARLPEDRNYPTHTQTTVYAQRMNLSRQPIPPEGPDGQAAFWELKEGLSGVSTEERQLGMRLLAQFCTFHDPIMHSRVRTG